MLNLTAYALKRNNLKGLITSTNSDFAVQVLCGSRILQPINKSNLNPKYLSVLEILFIDIVMMPG